MKKFLLMALPVLALYSCYTDPAPGTARIIVMDENDFTVPLVTVEIVQRGQLETGIIHDLGMTNNNGVYEYVHTFPETDMALPVIADVKATIGNPDRDGLGIINIKPGEVTTEIIHIYP